MVVAWATKRREPSQGLSSSVFLSRYFSCRYSVVEVSCTAWSRSLPCVFFQLLPVSVPRHLYYPLARYIGSFYECSFEICFTWVIFLAGGGGAVSLPRTESLFCCPRQAGRRRRREREEGEFGGNVKIGGSPFSSSSNSRVVSLSCSLRLQIIQCDLGKRQGWCVVREVCRFREICGFLFPVSCIGEEKGILGGKYYMVSGCLSVCLSVSRRSFIGS